MAKLNLAGLNPRQWSWLKRLVVFSLSIALVAGLLLVLMNSGEGDSTGPADDSSSSQSPAVEDDYNPCLDESLAEKPIGCDVAVNYPVDFIQRFRSTPEQCWVIVDNLAYDVTIKPGGYVYPGPGDLQTICGQDATEQFMIDAAEAPDEQFIRGSVS